MKNNHQQLSVLFLVTASMIARKYLVEIQHWRISIKQVMGLATIAAALAACEIMKPTQTIEIIVSSTPAITETYTPTATSIEELITSTINRTPTETAAPVPEYATKAKELGQFTLAPSIEEAVKNKMTRRTMNSPVTLDFDPVRNFEVPSDSQVWFYCLKNVNCANPEFVRVKDPAGGFDRWYIMLETRNPGDTESKIMVLYIGADMNRDFADNQAQRNLIQFNKYFQDNYKMKIILLAKRKNGVFENPYLKELYSSYSEEQQKDFATMGSNDTLPDSLSGVPIWAERFELGV